MMGNQEIIIPSLMDVHCHLREGDELLNNVYYAAMWCDTIVAMPNTEDPLTTPEKIKNYRIKVREALEFNKIPVDSLNIIIPLYLTQETTPEDIYNAVASDPSFICVKAYPKGRTSHSSHGISNFKAMVPTFKAMGRMGIKLLIHPEHPDYDSWKGERMFFKEIWPYIHDLTQSHSLRVSLEHLSTAEGFNAVLQANSSFVVGTITPQHMISYIGDLVDQLDSSFFCKPVLKDEPDRDMLLGATLGYDCFSLGSDSAPWSLKNKTKHKPCGGCWTAPWLPQFMAMIFESRGNLENLQTFTHDNAVRWWGLPPAKGRIKLTKGETIVAGLPFSSQAYLPYFHGQDLTWKAERLS